MSTERPCSEGNAFLYVVDTSYVFFPDYVLFFDHQIKIFLKQTRLLSKDYTNLKFVVEDVVKNDFRIFDFSDISFHLTNIL